MSSVSGTRIGSYWRHWWECGTRGSNALGRDANGPSIPNPRTTYRHSSFLRLRTLFHHHFCFPLQHQGENITKAIHCPTMPMCDSRDQPISAPLAGLKRLTIVLLHDRGFVLDVSNNVRSIDAKAGNRRERRVYWPVCDSTWETRRRGSEHLSPSHVSFNNQSFPPGCQMKGKHTSFGALPTMIKLWGVLLIRGGLECSRFHPGTVPTKVELES